MRLMRESGVELETSTTRTLLRFLVHTQVRRPEPSYLSRPSSFT
jgi:hypothetical protein